MMVPKSEYTAIRDRFLMGDACKDLAKDYNTGLSSISKILKKFGISPKRHRLITLFRHKIRNCAKYKKWKCNCLERDNSMCQVTGQTGCPLDIHHIKELNDIIKTFLDELDFLTLEDNFDQLFQLAQEYPDLWDLSNGMAVSEEGHKKIHEQQNKPT